MTVVRGRAILATDVGAAHADRDRLDEDRPVAHIRLGDVLEARGPGLVRFQGDDCQLDSFTSVQVASGLYSVSPGATSRVSSPRSF